MLLESFKLQFSPKRLLSPRQAERALLTYHRRLHQKTMRRRMPVPTQIHPIFPDTHADMHTLFTFPPTWLLQDHSAAVPIKLRGMLARAVLYAMVIYQVPIPAPFEDVNVSNDQLLLWHDQHPVTKYEYDTCKFVEGIQGNPNPFVLYPHANAYETAEDDAYYDGI